MLGETTTTTTDSNAIQHVAFETGERFILAATNHKVYRIDLYRRTDAATTSTSLSNNVFEHVGGKGHFDVERIGGADNDDEDGDSHTYSSPLVLLFLLRI